jgi:predicted dehydrogenase
MREEKKSSMGKGISRREFIGGAAAAIGAFTIIPRHVLGAESQPAASDKLNIAFIGVGGKGESNVEALSGQNIVAFCDVDDARAAKTYAKYPDVKKYRDYRVMLDKEQKNIDGVVVTTPDHMHYIIAMTAIKLGKHVYCEKPLTHTIVEARHLAAAAKEAKVATQMGNSGQASEQTRLVAEWIADGAIGQVREVHDWTDRPYWPQGIERPAETPQVPATLDWDLWLGCAPTRPYNPIYLPFNWRGWWDFGTGALGDMGCHSFDPIFRALKLGHCTCVEASSTYQNKVSTETYPHASVVRYEFPARGNMPPVKLTWYDGGLKPAKPEELEANRKLRSTGVLYVGDKGKMLDGRLIPETAMQQYTQPAKTLPRSPGHYEEWLAACKGGEPAGANFDFASMVTEVVLLGNIALRTREKLYWDGPNMKITNVPDANKYLSVEYRQGWSI